jgi:hypothetical protein
MGTSQPKEFTTGLDEFRAALADYKSISSWIMGASVAVPLVDYVAGLGPPWPWNNSVPVITSVAELLALMCAFHFLSRANRRITNRILFALIVTLLILFGGYLYFNSQYTFVSPVNDEKYVKGFTLRTDVTAVISESYTSDDALRGAEYRPEEVWTRTSITLMRLTLLALWLGSFVSLSTTLAIFVLFHRRRIKRKT